MKRQMFNVLAGLFAAFVFPALQAFAEENFTLPAGTTLHVRLTTTLSTRTNQNGDPWTGKVIEPIFAKGQEVIPADSTVEGRVTYVKPPGRAKGVAEMRLIAETITTPGDLQFSIAAGLEDAQGAEGAKVGGEEGTIKGPGKSKKGAAIETGVGAGAGAATGAIINGGSGALYGAAIGAGVMGIRNLLKHHKDIVVPQGTELTFVIARTTAAKKITQPAESSTQ